MAVCTTVQLCTSTATLSVSFLPEHRMGPGRSCLSRLLCLVVYTILGSCRYENIEDQVESADSAMTGLAQLTLGAPPPHCRDPLKDTPLAELLFPALPNSLQASSQVQDVLLVLKILECLNR